MFDLLPLHHVLNCQVFFYIDVMQGRGTRQTHNKQRKNIYALNRKIISVVRPGLCEDNLLSTKGLTARNVYSQLM